MLAAGLSLLAGCEGTGQRKLPPEPVPQARDTRADDALARGTIGAEVAITNLHVQPLRGFGLVVGLDGRGSSDCPTVIREYLLDEMSRQLPQGARERGEAINPATLIDSPNTAVVEVVGVVPAGSRPGTHFDVHVAAVIGTSTQSLEGGLLLPTPMRYFNPDATGKGLVQGRVLAEAGGPLFVDPLHDPRLDPDAGDPRRGYILGGGRAVEERPFRLVLLRPNYRMAKEIAQRINERFGPEPAFATPYSAGYLEVTTPPAYARRPTDFRNLILQLPIDVRPEAIDQKLADLARIACADDASIADLDRVSLTWEALGRRVLSRIQPYYTYPQEGLRHFAARAGARLGDSMALPVLGAVAGDDRSSHRMDAIDALGDSTSPQAGRLLEPLLSHADESVRIAAYEALIRRDHPRIRSIRFPHVLDRSRLSFILDVIDCEGPPLIYIRRTRLPRIAIFGTRTPLAAPIFYSPPGEAVTVHTVQGSDDVRVFGKRQNFLSGEIVLPPRVVDFIMALADVPIPDKSGALRGLGLPYASVVRVLTDLRDDGAIAANVALERTALEQFFAPRATERPEGERAPAPGIGMAAERAEQ